MEVISTRKVFKGPSSTTALSTQCPAVLSVPSEVRCNGTSSLSFLCSPSWTCPDRCLISPWPDLCLPCGHPSSAAGHSPPEPVHGDGSLASRDGLDPLCDPSWAKLSPCSQGLLHRCAARTGLDAWKERAASTR